MKTLVLLGLMALVFLAVNVFGGGDTVAGSASSIIPQTYAVPTQQTTLTAVVTHVEVVDKFSLPVVQQPGQDAAWVNDTYGQVTQFGLASTWGSVGILAHNTRDGILFNNIAYGDSVFVTYADGRTEQYQITEIKKYQARTPSNPYSDFLDLGDPSGQWFSSTDAFMKVYAREDSIVFQTCIEENGVMNWGRLFVIGVRVQ